jgi:hypothetical protein
MKKDQNRWNNALAMGLRHSLFCSLLLISFSSLAQRPHVELGGVLGFKDEFHFKPQFDATSKYTELHIWEIEAFLRVSKSKFGGEIGIGFEKASNYFRRDIDGTGDFGYANLNRVSLNLSAFYYFIKKSDFKWDLQLGLRNYFNTNKFMYVPLTIERSPYKLAARATTSFTFKNFIFGLYYEYDLKSDYSFKPKGANFGFRAGFIY